MANLNWRQKLLRQEISVSAAGASTLVFGLGSAERDALAQALREIFAEGETAELRVDLPKGWILFWKPRAGESRLLLSHPSKAEYVATVALLPEHGQRFADRLANLTSGTSLTVGEVAEDAPIAGLSNVEVAIELAVTG